MSVHSVKRDQYHLAWDNKIPPVLRIPSGSAVTFDCLDASNGQIRSTSISPKDISSLDFSQLDQVNGPIYVEDAQPGDTLQIDVLNIEISEDWGWTALIPGFGLLADEFPEPEIRIWKIDKERGVAYLTDTGSRGGVGNVLIPLRPFAGEMGVARGEMGAFSTIPPYNTGGNIDTRHVTVGSTLYLPVEVPGALFSIGDGHAAQGDGEVCGTAIETSIKVTVRLTVIKDKPYVRTPHFRIQIPVESAGEELYCTTGVGPDIREATRDAVRNMINFLGAEYGLDRSTAYMICSVAGELRMHEVVDMPNYVIGMMMPKSIFDKENSKK